MDSKLSYIKFDANNETDLKKLEEYNIIVSEMTNNYILIDTESVARRKYDIKIKFHKKARENQIKIGNTLSFRSNISINGSNNIIDVSNSDQKITCTIDVRGNSNTLSIGKNCSINQANLLLDGDESNLSIGIDCMLSYGIRIRTSDSHAIIDLGDRKKINEPKDVKIGSRVWIASNVMVLKGVTIGAGSIIAAASVVTKDIPPTSLAAGIPARVIRSAVSWTRAANPNQDEIDSLCDFFESEGYRSETES